MSTASQRIVEGITGIFIYEFRRLFRKIIFFTMGLMFLLGLNIFMLMIYMAWQMTR